MDVDTSSRVFQLKALAVVLFVVVFIGASVSGLELEDSPGNAVVSVEEKFREGNFGTNHIFEVSLENGSTASYGNYTSHHPLCPEHPEKCGEDSVDPGWGGGPENIEQLGFQRG